jgi:hypothetical protein
MLYFTAKQVGDQRKSALKWATAWEENNDRFELERSDDGSHWAVIGTVRGSGSVASESTYNFIDDVPSVPLSYYRIKQVDIDGNTSYSATRLVDFSQTASDEYNIYPNPASSRVYIDFVKDQKTVNYELVDLTGRTVLTGAARNTNFIIINTDKLNSGIYFLRLNGLSKKIVINK